MKVGRCVRTLIYYCDNSMTVMQHGEGCILFQRYLRFAKTRTQILIGRRELYRAVISSFASLNHVHDIF